jgi:IS66 C-terminal element
VRAFPRLILVGFANPAGVLGNSCAWTCKLNDVDPLAYLTDALARIVNGHPNSDINQLLPWAYGRHELKAVA